MSVGMNIRSATPADAKLLAELTASFQPTLKLGRHKETHSE
jgi:hypothetical protein